MLLLLFMKALLLVLEMAALARALAVKEEELKVEGKALPAREEVRVLLALRAGVGMIGVMMGVLVAAERLLKL